MVRHDLTQSAAIVTYIIQSKGVIVLHNKLSAPVIVTSPGEVSGKISFNIMNGAPHTASKGGLSCTKDNSGGAFLPSNGVNHNQITCVTKNKGLANAERVRASKECQSHACSRNPGAPRGKETGPPPKAPVLPVSEPKFPPGNSWWVQANHGAYLRPRCRAYNAGYCGRPNCTFKHINVKTGDGKCWLKRVGMGDQVVRVDPGRREVGRLSSRPDHYVLRLVAEVVAGRVKVEQEREEYLQVISPFSFKGWAPVKVLHPERCRLLSTLISWRVSYRRQVPFEDPEDIGIIRMRPVFMRKLVAVCKVKLTQDGYDLFLSMDQVNVATHYCIMEDGRWYQRWPLPCKLRELMELEEIRIKCLVSSRSLVTMFRHSELTEHVRHMVKWIKLRVDKGLRSVFLLTNYRQSACYNVITSPCRAGWWLWQGGLCLPGDPEMAGDIRTHRSAHGYAHFVYSLSLTTTEHEYLRGQNFRTSRPALIRDSYFECAAGKFLKCRILNEDVRAAKMSEVSFEHPLGHLELVIFEDSVNYAFQQAQIMRERRGELGVDRATPIITSIIR